MIFDIRCYGSGFGRGTIRCKVEDLLQFRYQLPKIHMLLGLLQSDNNDLHRRNHSNRIVVRLLLDLTLMLLQRIKHIIHQIKPVGSDLDFMTVRMFCIQYNSQLVSNTKIMYTTVNLVNLTYHYLYLLPLSSCSVSKQTFMWAKRRYPFVQFFCRFFGESSSVIFFLY